MAEQMVVEGEPKKVVEEASFQRFRALICPDLPLRPMLHLRAYRMYGAPALLP